MPIHVIENELLWLLDDVFRYEVPSEPEGCNLYNVMLRSLCHGANGLRMKTNLRFTHCKHCNNYFNGQRCAAHSMGVQGWANLIYRLV